MSKKSIVLSLILLLSFFCYSQDDNCRGLSFHSIYSFNNYTFLSDHFSTKDSSSVFLGYRAPKSSAIFKIKKDGNVAWSKQLSSSTALNFVSGKELSDSNYILSGGQFKVNSDGSTDYTIILIKYDTAGQVLWQQGLKINVPKGKLSAIDYIKVQEGIDGSILLSANISSMIMSTGYKFCLIARLNKDGNIIWSKLFETRNDIRLVIPEQTTTNIVNAFGNFDFSDFLSYPSQRKTGFSHFQFDALTGNALNNTSCLISLSQSDVSSSVFFGGFNAVKHNSDTYNLYGSFHTTLGSYMQAFVLSYQNFGFPSGYFIKSTIINTNLYSKFTRVDTSGNAGFVLVGGSTNAKMIYAAIDASGKVSSQISKGIINSNWNTSDDENLLAFKSPGIFSFGVPVLINGKKYFHHFQLGESIDQSTSTCIGSDTSGLVYTEFFKTSPYTWKWDAEYSNVLTVAPINVITEDVPIYKEEVCISKLPPKNYFNLGEDTVICPGGSLQLKTSYPYKAYAWQDASTDPMLTVTSPGMYSLTAQDNCDYKYYDTVKIDYTPKENYFSLGKDTVLCPGISLPLQTTYAYKSYAWQDNTAAPVFTVSSPGVYHLETTDNCNYKYYDTIKIDYSTTTLTLGNNYQICKGDVARLTLPPGFKTYAWQPQTGVTVTNNGFEFSPDKTTRYIIKAKNALGCVSADSITVEVKNCPSKFFMPSAFSPNMDGKNEIFKPYIEGRLVSYKLIIYNRWGNEIFSTTNSSQGWNGLFKGMLQSSAAYIWLCKYQFKGEAEETKKGSFVLIR